MFNKTIRNPIYYIETKPTSPTIHSVLVVELCWLSSRIDKIIAQVDCSKKEEAILWHNDFCKELKKYPVDYVLKLLQERYPPTSEEQAIMDKQMPQITEEEIVKTEKKSRVKVIN